jgi:hypothetical protein
MSAEVAKPNPVDTKKNDDVSRPYFINHHLK